jgi:uncharacterized protein YndB with AHSA1/START domain
VAALGVLKSTLEEQRMTAEAGSTFIYVSFIRTTPEALWQAVTQKEFIKQFWFGMEFDTTWEVGSPWTLKFADGRLADGGTVTEFVPMRRFKLSWRNEWSEELKAEGFGTLTMELDPADDVMKLSVTHEMPVDDSKLINAVSGGWPRILSNLKSLLETGQVVMSAKS